MEGDAQWAFDVPILTTAENVNAAHIDARSRAPGVCGLTWTFDGLPGVNLVVQPNPHQLKPLEATPLTFCYNTKHERLVFDVTFRAEFTQSVYIKFYVAKKAAETDLLLEIRRTRQSQLPALTLLHKSDNVVNVDGALLLQGATFEFELCDVTSNHVFQKKGKKKLCDNHSCGCDGNCKEFHLVAEMFSGPPTASPPPASLWRATSCGFQVRSKPNTPKKRAQHELNVSANLYNSSTKRQRCEHRTSSATADINTSPTLEGYKVSAIPLPNARLTRAYHTATMVGIDILMFGGRIDCGGLFGAALSTLVNAANTTWILSPFVCTEATALTHHRNVPALRWKECRCIGPLPPPRCEHTAVGIDRPQCPLMVVFGGQSAGGKLLNDTWILEYDPIRGTGQWHELTCNGGALPCARMGHAAVGYIREQKDGMLEYVMIVHGGQAEGKKTLGDIWCLTLSIAPPGAEGWNARAVWEMLPTGEQRSPGARSHHSATLMRSPMDGNCKVVVFGGSRRIMHEGKRDIEWFDDLYALDLSTHVWQKVEPANKPGLIPCKRDGHVAVPLGDSKLLLFGGWVAQKRFTEGAERYLTPASPSPTETDEQLRRLHAGIHFATFMAQRPAFAADFWIFDFASMTWREIQPTNESSRPSASGHAAGTVVRCQHGWQLYLFGGEVFPPAITDQAFLCDIDEGPSYS